ncbi:MAG: type VI secretion system baseplate subunit TssF [Polyangiales bacterium]
MSFARYYQAELGYLRDMGRAFGESHPGIAGMLAERGGDPDVERLLEGFAFLSARVRQRIDQAMPSLLESLTELLLPQLVQPLPAATIVQFSPTPRTLRGRQHVAAGTMLAAKPRDGTACLFRTAEDVDLVPASITAQRLDDTHPARPRIVLTLQIAKGGHEAVFAGGLRLHLHGELALTSQLCLWLTRHCRSVTLSAGEQTLTVPATSVHHHGLDGALWPWPRFAPAALRLLTEYHTLPSKFLFVTLTGIEGAARFSGETVQLTFELERPPRLPGPLPQETFRLHCVPAVNLFDVDADPVRWDALSRPRLLRASGVDPHHVEVHTVREVLGVTPGGRRTYRPFLGFQHQRGGAEPYYVLTRELSPIDQGVDHYLSLAGPRDRPLADELEPHTLSIAMTCTHRALPNALGVGDVCVPTPSSPVGVPFRNIGPISRPARPPLGAGSYAPLMAHLAASRRALTDVDALRALLRLYNFQQHSDHPAGRVNDARISTLAGMREQAATRILQGAPVRGSKLTLTAHEDGFLSKGDAFLFASVLDRLFGMQVHVNTFSQLGITLLPSNDALEWEPRWRS